MTAGGQALGDVGDRGVAVVFGASGAIGSATVAGLVDRGWTVVAHHRSGPAPTGAATVVRADLTDWPATRAAAAEVLERHGPPDLVVNCAGRRDDGLLVAQAPERWTSVLHDNVTVAYHPLRALLPAMVRRRSGAVVQVSSVAGLVASPGQSAYAAAKAAVIAMLRTLAAEYGRRGLRFNTVAPGFVATAMTDDVPDRVRAAIEERQALPGTVPVADVVATIVHLAETPSLTGQILRPDLGLQL
ncbi:MAG TPA: SDR family NAD(P)-dependent oxidoreductase, partial [Acidimicrobiales bacterium]